MLKNNSVAVESVLAFSSKLIVVAEAPETTMPDGIYIFRDYLLVLNQMALQKTFLKLLQCYISIVYRVTSTEPYFLSEGAYSPPDELENTREVVLHVITIGAFIEDSTLVSPI